MSLCPKLKRLGLTIFACVSIGLTACGVDTSDREDRTPPGATLLTPNGGETVIGEAIIAWETDEPNRRTVEIELSYDSGATYTEVIATAVPDIGEFLWDTFDDADGRHCRIRVTPTDIRGNVGDPAESAADFIINNVPEVFGVARYHDPNGNGPDEVSS